MWLSKFLDLTDDVKTLANEIKSKIFKERKQQKLTPLEFTILEIIFNNNKQIYGYDLIKNLNDVFAGTWEAQSGTVYPILSKLKKDGFLTTKPVKSPLGPIKKLYFLTNAGEELLKVKVSKGFLEQVKFIENFLIELSSVYIHSFPEEKQDEEIIKLQALLEQSFENVREKIPLKIKFKTKCPECNAELDRSNAIFCSLCGASLSPEEDEEINEFGSVEDINGK